MAESLVQLSTGAMHMAAQTAGKRLKLVQFASESHSWLHPAFRSRLFSVYIDGRRYDAANMNFEGISQDDSNEAVNHVTVHFKTRRIAVDFNLKIYREMALVEFWPVLQNDGPGQICVSRIDAFSLDLQCEEPELQYYTSGWGQEFELCKIYLDDKFVLQNRSGRSSKGLHPWFGLFSTGNGMLSGSIAWSGNWVFRFEPQEPDCIRISGGMHGWGFEKMLQPGDRMDSPPCILVLGSDLDATANQYTRVGRRHWIPSNSLSKLPPVEWNHWWSYEDVDINEEVFVENVKAAAEMGVEVCTLDAGWFGPSETGTHWYDYRGDWDMVNKSRFPKGIRWLAAQVHDRKLRFGLWCEIEGLGKRAHLAEERPNYVAERMGKRLGYVCFGNPEAQEWAFQTLSRLITSYGCDWIKLDFNLDPGAGCDRTDHGHQSGDGLYEHYRGYYGVLERIRETFPEVVLESCSSGGLRIDLGILRRTHLTFLSDPDWPVHDLQIFWGASTMIAPGACLHWSFSDWRMENPPLQQNFNPHSPQLTQKQLDYYTRISMLGAYGFSQKLPGLPAWAADRLIYHTNIYKDQVRDFVRNADLYRLTGQPRRSGLGERWSAFQYSLPDLNEHLLFVFRLPGGESARTIRLRSLQKDHLYTISDPEAGTSFQETGQSLMTAGIAFQQLLEEDSALLKIR